MIHRYVCVSVLFFMFVLFGLHHLAFTSATAVEHALTTPHNLIVLLKEKSCVFLCYSTLLRNSDRLTSVGALNSQNSYNVFCTQFFININHDPPPLPSFFVGELFIPQLAPAVQFQLALAGALSGWQYGLIAAVSPLAELEDAKDLLFDSEVEGIRAAAASAAAAAKAGAADAEEGSGIAGDSAQAKERALAA